MGGGLTGSLAREGARPWGPDGWELMSRSFFRRPATVVAPELLGCVLVHDDAEGRVAAEIVEVEAYMGSQDPASHSYRGRTARNAVMFGEAGHVYVYFTYGMHFCVNLVCELPGDATAVLLRAGWIVEGTDLAIARRSGGADLSASHSGKRLARLASGPARLCQALGVASPQNGADACSPDSAVRVCAPAGFSGLPASEVASGPRVGVSTAAEVPWRFWVAGDNAVSAYRPHVPRDRQRRRSGGERLLPGS
ncbi:MAG TPA: DNA-3-methyladenine glycosylase [Streptosporangiaceae bacterium]|nr:DNA-3-methyladenine glycosylase [Streptosporangiaceae bacterium]